MCRRSYNTAMSSQRDKAKRWWPQLSIRELLLCVSIVALSLGWWTEHVRRTQEKYRTQEMQLMEWVFTLNRETICERADAVRERGREKALVNGPVLLYALTDPAPQVSREARQALRLLSGNPSGFGFPDYPDENQLAANIAGKAWMDWYVTTRQETEPGYELPRWATFRPYLHPTTPNDRSLPIPSSAEPPIELFDLFEDAPTSREKP